jgi:Ca2+-binding RTX toxin-like protein
MLNSQIISSVQQYLTQFANTEGFAGLIADVYGIEVDNPLLLGVRQQWLNGDFGLIPTIRVLSDGELGTANGSYAASLDQILVSADFVERSDLFAVVGLLLEEIGHKLDRVLKGNVDSAGDEGEIFRLLATGQAVSPEVLARLRSENDHAVIVVDGKSIEVEKQDFTGTNGDDFLEGTTGNDRLFGLAGNDILRSDIGSDILNGDGGIDTYKANYSDRSTGLIMTYDSATGNGTVVIGTEIDTFTSIESFNSFIGTDFNDTIFGGSNYDFFINGGAGNDSISGNAGTDDLSGADGNDTLNGGADDDTLNGDAGNDILNGDAGDDQLKSDLGSDNINGGSGNDVYRANYSDRSTGLIMTYDSATGNGTVVIGAEIDTFTSIESFNYFIGTDFNDTIFGGSNYDFFINGGAGNDSISGNAGTDDLSGADGNDTLNGGADDDTLNGDAGNDVLNGVSFNSSNSGDNEIDVLTGGTGSDRFVLGDTANIYYDDQNISTIGDNDYARITDFTSTEDKIQLQGSASNYILTVSGTNTNLYTNKAGSEPDELIATIENVTGLNLTSSSFLFVPPNNKANSNLKCNAAILV